MQQAHIVLFGATGKVGQQVAQLLLEHQYPVTLVARTTEKLRHLASKGATVVKASFADVDQLTQVLTGADIVLTLVPSNHAAPDFLAEQRLAADAQITAIRRSGIRNVLNLSSAGAHVIEGNGVLTGLAEMEVKLNQLEGVNVLHLRPTFYMENAFYSIGLIKQKGILGLPTDGDHAFPMIATKDVAHVIAQKLMHFDNVGKSVLPLLGPRDYSLREFTSELGAAIGLPALPYVRFTPEDIKAGIVASGASASYADRYIELAMGFERGLLNYEKRTAGSTTTTTLREFAERVFAPVYRQ